MEELEKSIRVNKLIDFYGNLLTKHQEEIISAYLPKMMSEEEVRSEIEKLDDKSMPSIMKHFKANFQGKADMGMVNKIARSL